MGRRSRHKTGVVRTWLDNKGIGFITPDEGGEDIFVGDRAIEGASSFCPGDKVIPVIDRFVRSVDRCIEPIDSIIFAKKKNLHTFFFFFSLIFFVYFLSLSLSFSIHTLSVFLFLSVFLLISVSLSLSVFLSLSFLSLSFLVVTLS